MEYLELAVALVVILAAAELFTNGIEWFGHKLNLAEGAVGSVLAAGVSPLAGGPGLEMGSLAAELVAFGPAGFLWLGLIAVIATPICRVLAAAIAYGRSGDWPMVAIAMGILGIIVVGVITSAADTV